MKIKQERTKTKKENLPDKLLEVEKRIDSIEDKLKTKETKKEKKVEEPLPYKDKLKVRKLYASLPVFDNTSSIINKSTTEGEIVLLNDGSNRRIYAQLSGTWYKVDMN